MSDLENPDRKIGLTQWYGQHLTKWTHEGSAKLQSLYLPVIDSQQNISLAYATSFVLCVLVLLTVMYLCRVFVKA